MRRRGRDAARAADGGRLRRRQARSRGFCDCDSLRVTVNRRRAVARLDDRDRARFKTGQVNARARDCRRRAAVDGIGHARRHVRQRAGVRAGGGEGCVGRRLLIGFKLIDRDALRIGRENCPGRRNADIVGSSRKAGGLTLAGGPGLAVLTELMGRRGGDAPCAADDARLGRRQIRRFCPGDVDGLHVAVELCICVRRWQINLYTVRCRYAGDLHRNGSDCRPACPAVHAVLHCRRDSR